LSLYHPFPLRMDTNGSGTNIQYDACLQIGEFGTTSRDPDKNVFLVPLKVSPNPGPGSKFINTLGSKIPSIVGAQPDRLLGYPDTDVALGAEWSLSQVLKADRSYYTWVTSEGTRVIVMGEPILIAEADMNSIKRLPVTPPGDVIHEIKDVRYKPAPPIDSQGNPVPCKSSIPVPQLFPGPSALAMTNVNKPAVSGTDWLAIILGIVGSIAVFIGVWFGLKAAMGPGGTLLKSLGDALGKSIAGGYGALKNAKVATANAVGIGSKSSFPSRRTTQRIRTPVQVADAAAPSGTPAAMGNISPVNIPEPKGDFTMVNPAYSSLSRKDYADRLRTRRNPLTPKIKTPTQLAQTPATPGTPAEVANIPTPDADELLRRQRAERNRLAQPAGTGLFDLGNTPGPIDDIAQRKPTPRKPSVLSQPSESNTQRIARLARDKRAATPVRRRKIMVESEDEAETPSLARTASIANRLKRASTRAKESVTDFDKAVENTPTSDPADPTRIFGSRAIRQRYGDFIPTGGKRKRKNRLKTGRKV
jgi:hypothetical protein